MLLNKWSLLFFPITEMTLFIQPGMIKKKSKQNTLKEKKNQCNLTCQSFKKLYDIIIPTDQDLTKI